MSTGIFGFPNLDAAVCALQTVRQWLDEDETHRQAVDCIVFCVFLDKDKDIYERHMPLFFPLTQDELEGKASDGLDRVANGATDSTTARRDEKGENGGESKRQQGERTDEQQGADVMEVRLGDTVWAPTDSSTALPTKPTDDNDAAGETDQPVAAQQDGKPLQQHSSITCALRFVECSIFAALRVSRV